MGLEIFYIWSVKQYEAETLTLTGGRMKVENFGRWAWRKLLGITWQESEEQGVTEDDRSRGMDFSLVIQRSKGKVDFNMC